jgi:hypothetical protein
MNPDPDPGGLAVFEEKMFFLKVVGNEKIGRSGGRQMLGYGPGPWRSRFIFNLTMQFMIKKYYFLFRL